MGLGALYGASGIQDQMRARVAQRLAQQQAQQQMDLALRGADRSDKQLAAQIEQNELARQANADQRKFSNDISSMQIGHTLDEATPPGRLPLDSPIAGMLVKVGAAKPVDERPEVTTGPLLPGDTGAMLPAGYEKRETALQKDRRTDNERFEAQQESLKQDRITDNQRQAEAAIRAIEKDKADQSYKLATLNIARQNAASAQQRNDIDLQIKQEKLQGEQRERIQKTTATKGMLAHTLTLLDDLEKHPGLKAATGAYELRGFTQDARNFNARRTQLVNILAFQNLSALKGPLSDKDILFLQSISSRLGDKNLDDVEALAAMKEMREFVKLKQETVDVATDTPGGDPANPLGLDLPPKRK